MFFTTYYTPIYFQFTQNNTSLMAAVQLLPYLLLTITFNLASGWALPKIKYYMPMCLVSGILMTVAGALFVAYLSLSTPTRHIYGFSILMGTGTRITMQLGYSVSSLKIQPTDILGAINLQNVAQISTMVICLVIASQAFQSSTVNNLNHALAGRGFSLADIHSTVLGTQSVVQETGW